MPRELVVAEQRVLNDKSGLDMLLYLASRFQVSVEFAAVRLLWDLSALETAVAVFREVSTLGPQNGNSRLRRYFGRAVRHRLRKEGKNVLEFVTKAIANGPPFDVLDKVALQNPNLLSLQWKVSTRPRYRSVSALLDFH